MNFLNKEITKEHYLVIKIGLANDPNNLDIVHNKKMTLVKLGKKEEDEQPFIPYAHDAIRDVIEEWREIPAYTWIKILILGAIAGIALGFFLFEFAGLIFLNFPITYLIMNLIVGIFIAFPLLIVVVYFWDKTERGIRDQMQEIFQTVIILTCLLFLVGTVLYYS